MEKKSISINLLKNKKNSFVNRFTDWALTVGRLLIILTEAIALSAFLYRFSLDRKIIDLNSNIKQQESIVKLLKNNEDKYRSLQERLSLAVELSNKGADKIKVLKDVLSFAPQELTISNLVVSDNRLTINAFAQSTASLALFTKSLKNYPKITKLNLDNIQIKPANGLVVSFSANFQ